MNEVPTSPQADAFDVLIVGAGPVGLALAGMLTRRSGTCDLRIALLDGQPPAGARTNDAAPADDPRVLALSHGSRILLEPLGWPAVDATPIERIHVSQRGHFGRTLIDRREHDLPALGYVVRYGALRRALSAGLDAQPRPPARLYGTAAEAPYTDAGLLALPTDGPDGRRLLRAALVVNAEGGLYGDRTRAASAARRRQRDYGQTAIVAVVGVAAPRPGVAWERFTAEGPLALLPLGGPGRADYGLVWCQRPETAARRMALSDAVFAAELHAAFGDRMGAFVRIGRRAAFPLGLDVLDPHTDAAAAQERVVAVGNAAQTLHPVAGQGLNLGLRDAHALLDTLARHGATPAAATAFAHRRRIDRRLTIGVTDALARAFTVDVGPLAALRGAALAALECVPPAKHALARQMMFGRR